MNTVIHESLGKAPDLDVSVQAAAVLLSLAMRDTESPVSDLGQALSRMVSTVTMLRSHVQQKPLNGEPNGHQLELEGELSVCIQSLQFHDRLIQQLAAVRNLLTGLSSHGPLNVAGFGAQRWEELLDVLRDRLSADQHHQLFDLLMRTGTIDGDLRDNAAPEEGSVELF
ncbi:MAG: hypothetical protein WDO56_10605 [Gammaproteobacteria bacterium]